MMSLVWILLKTLGFKYYFYHYFDGAHYRKVRLLGVGNHVKLPTLSKTYVWCKIRKIYNSDRSTHLKNYILKDENGNKFSFPVNIKTLDFGRIKNEF